MRYSNFAVVAICAVSLTTFAGTQTEETKSMSEGNKIETSNPNTKIAAISAEGNTTNRQHPAASQKKTSSAGSVKTTDNVQGLAPTDRRYRYHD